MSRSSDLRDAIRDHLKTVVPSGTPVDSVIIPNFNRSQCDPARVVVMTQSRTIDSTQGPDDRRVEISIGVIGALPPLEGPSVTWQQRNAQELAACDEYDALLELLLAEWTPNGPLTQQPLADHVFGIGSEVLQEDAVDPTFFRQENIWLGLFSVTYFDSLDESE